jgi:hypothetical protein
MDLLANRSIAKRPHCAAIFIGRSFRQHFDDVATTSTDRLIAIMRSCHGFREDERTVAAGMEMPNHDN